MENKLYNRLMHMLNNETDDFFINIALNDDVANNLLDFQFVHVLNLLTALNSTNEVLDGSDTGTGKTYTSIAICKQLRLKPLIICPNSVRHRWQTVADLFRVVPLGIVNYECIKTGKYFDRDGKRVDCPYIEASQLDNNNNTDVKFKWNLPKFSIVIFDEAHRCKNAKSLNGKLLLSCKEMRHKFPPKVLMLSATIADKPESFHIFGYMLGFYKTLRQGRNWIRGMILEDNTYIGQKVKLSAINQQIYPNKGSRMRICELGDKFPLNQISVDCYEIDKKDRDIVNHSFELFEQSTNTIKSNQGGKRVLADITNARQLIEKIKIPIIEEMTMDFVENGFAVVIFLNYTESIRQLAAKLGTTCIVNGEQSIEARTQNIDDFQANRSNIIICNIGITEGLSLHDEHGVPRVSIISPSFSVTNLVQALGRIVRAGAKTPALQRIVYCANTCEQVICNRVRNNLEFLSKLNDNDLTKI